MFWFLVDEPVDLNVLLSQNINVKVSYVEDYNVFYVHLEKEKAATINEAINTFMQKTPIEVNSVFLLKNNVSVFMVCFIFSLCISLLKSN